MPPTQTILDSPPAADPLHAAVERFLGKYESASPPQFLVAAYEHFLNRSIDEAGYNNWLIQLYSGLSRAELVRRFLESEEFTRLRREGAPFSLFNLNLNLNPEPPLPDRSTLEQYQDIWLKGQLHKQGVRTCEDRFHLISNFCRQFARPFTVLDIGSNLGYFSLRLTENFDCTAVALEGIYGDWLQEILTQNQNTRVILLKRIFKLEDLRALAQVEHFDLVLGLSVIHHLDGSFDESLEVLRSLGDHLIVELPFEANACGQEIVKQASTATLPAEAKLLGYGKSHLQDGDRPIYLLSRPKTTLAKSFLGTGRSDLSLTIESTFEKKRVQFHNKDESRDWLRGINLQTFLWFNGSWPSRASIADCIEAKGPPPKKHRDVQPWNIVLRGDGVEYIDFDDPNHGLDLCDAEHLKRLLCLLRSEPPKLNPNPNLNLAPAPDSADTRLERISCPFCFATDAQPFRTLADIVKCSNCDTVYLRTRATVDAMEKLYQSYGDEGSHIAIPKFDEQVVTSVLRRDYFLREILQHLDRGQPVPEARGKLLDVGCGWGAFLFNARAYGFEPMGLEITRRAATYANQRLGIPVVHSQFLDTAYDADSLGVVTMLHVLEHLPRPREALKRTLQILKPGGLFCGMVPNIDSYCSINNRDEWFWLDPNYHYVHYSPATLRKHLQEAGFIVERIYTARGDYRVDFIRQTALARDPGMADDAHFQRFLAELETAGQGEEIRFFARKPGDTAPTLNVERSTLNALCRPVVPQRAVVSVIIPVLDDVAQVAHCLRALEGNPAIAEVVVADGRPAGAADLTDTLKGAHQAQAKACTLTVQILRDVTMDGFASICNRAAQSAKGEYLAFLHCSAEPEPAWLQHALARFSQNPDAGIVGSKLLYPDRSVQHCGVELFRGIDSTEAVWPIHRYRLFPESDPMVNRAEKVWATSAACLCVRRDLFEKIGGFSAEFPLWLAGPDLSLKGRTEGYTTYYEPASVAVLHRDCTIPAPPASEFARTWMQSFLRKWKPQLTRSELDTYLTRADGKFHYFAQELIPDLPNHAWTSSRLNETADRLFRLLATLEPFYVHFGGAGDALLMLSTFYDRNPGRVVLSFPNSIPAARSFFESFPLLEKVYFLPSTSSAPIHLMLRVLLKRLPNCLGMGVTPETDYFQEWNDQLDIFGKYGVEISPSWAREFKRSNEPFSVALAPKGSLTGMVGSKRNVIPAADWPELITFVQSCGYTPVILGTPDEHIDYPALPGCEDRRSYSFKSQMEAIASCEIFAGADSWGKTFAALAGLPTIVFEAVKGRDWLGKKDASDYVFIDPWPTIKTVRDLDGFKDIFWAEVNRLNVSSGRASSATFPRLQSCKEAASTKLRIAWEGSFSDLGSLSHVNRSLTKQLTQKNIQLTCVDSGEKLKTQAPPHTDVTVRHAWPPNWNPPTSGAWVLIQPWEFGSLPLDWIPHLQKVDEIWAPSDHVRRVYIESGVAPSQVKIVPNGIDPSLYRPEAPPIQLATTKRFKFLFVGGTITRKGADLLLRAYLETFARTDDVCLVIKDFGGQGVYAGQTLQAEIESARKNPDAPEILYLTEDISAGAMPGLYTACDCLVHPYRGEGFALPVLEAMACGLPIVVTAGGATDDFATDQFAYRIKAEPRRIGHRVGPFKLARPGWWLEPSLADLRQQMRWIVEHRDEARAKGRCASNFVRQHWTWERAAHIANSRLHDLVSGKEAAAKAIQDRRSRKVAMVELPPVALIGQLIEAREELRARRFISAWNLTCDAIAARPFHPEAWLLLAEIAKAAGDPKRAGECAREARELAPKWKPARKFLESLNSQTATFNSEVSLPELPEAKSPRLSVCIIAKDEEAFIEQCLRSVAGLASQIILADTGSNDRTVEIARHHGAEVHTVEWKDDFSAARNAALQHATGDWVLILDADEELPPESHVALRREIGAKNAMAYRLPIIDKGNEEEGCSYVPRLFRNAPGLFFVGRIHEQIFTSVEARRQEWGMENQLGTAVIWHHGYSQRVTRDRRKNERNLKLLTKAVEEFPNEPNLLMNFGLEMIRAGQLDAGLEQYWEAFHVLSAQRPEQIVPELRETLLTQLSTHLLAAKDYEGVVRALRSSLAKAGGLTASLHFTLGLALMELHKFTEAAEQMRHCLAKRDQPALSPINKEIRKAAPRHCLALCLKLTNQPRDASKAFRQAIQEDPQSYPAKYDYARFLAEQKLYVEALQQTHQLISEQPEQIAGWLLGGQIALSDPSFLSFALDWTGEAFKVFAGNEQVAVQRVQALLCGRELQQAHCVAAQFPSHPALVAARTLCEVTAECHSTAPPENEPAVSREFLRWYQLLLKGGACELLHTLHQNLARLTAVLPTAARLLNEAAKEAA